MKRKYSESAMAKEIITSTKKFKIDNKERYFNVYDDSNVIIMDKKLEIMKKRIRNRNENSLILISKEKIMGQIANVEFDENVINESYLGSMFEICKHCNAKHFSFEYTRDKQFSNCCRKGKVFLPENPPYLYKLENLSTGLSMDSINFRKNILSYNNALAFVSFGANFEILSSSGPQVIRICGQIYHNVYAFHPNINEARKYAQSYVLDNAKATAQRKKP